MLKVNFVSNILIYIALKIVIGKIFGKKLNILLKFNYLLNMTLLVITFFKLTPLVDLFIIQDAQKVLDHLT